MIVKINGRIFNEFLEVGFNSKLDAVAASFHIKARFNPLNQFHQQIFKPLAFNTVEFFDNDEQLIFTGVITNNSLTSTSTREAQQLTGYSTSGVIENTTIPQSYYPLEKNNITLQDITQTLLNEFSVNFVVDDSVQNDMTLEYSKTVAKPTETVKSFLANLAAQRNIVIGHNPSGALTFFRLDINATPVRFFNERNTLSMSFGVDGQNMYSDVVLMRQPSRSNPTQRPIDTVQNPLVGQKKTLTKILSSGTETDTQKAAENVLADQLKNIKFTLTFERIVDISVGDIVEVQNAEVYLYNRAKFVVSSIKTITTPTSTTSAIELLLPEAYTGQTPTNIFTI